MLISDGEWLMEDHNIDELHRIAAKMMIPRKQFDKRRQAYPITSIRQYRALKIFRVQLADTEEMLEKCAHGNQGILQEFNAVLVAGNRVVVDSDTQDSDLASSRE